MDTDESKPEKRKRGRRKKVVDNDVIMLDPITPEEPPSPSPSPAYLLLSISYGTLPYESMLVYFELLAQHIIGVIVILRSGMPLLAAEPYPRAADRTVPLCLANLGVCFFHLAFLLSLPL